jgi:magnesium-transporting ATPase (P-type)
LDYFWAVLSTMGGLALIFLGLDGSSSARVIQGSLVLFYALVIALFARFMVGYFKAHGAISRNPSNPPPSAIFAQRLFWAFAVLALIVVTAVAALAVASNPSIADWISPEKSAV